MKNSESSSTAAAAYGDGARRYALASDLARMCLPSQLGESHRRLAWVNSICFLFLLIGLAGLKTPKVAEKPLTRTEEVVPVVFMPPPEQLNPQPEIKQDEAPGPPDKSLPEVVAVAGVAAAEPLAEAVAVPVQGAAVLIPARVTTAPVGVSPAAPKPGTFEPGADDGGSYPKPEYPRFAQRNHYQGTVTLEIRVEPSGAIASAQVQKSSGYRILDEAALGVVKNGWRFPPGKPRWLVWPCTFRLE